MRSTQPEDRFEHPGLFAVKAQELPLSGQALLELMRAVLAHGKPFRFCARGWSMLPFIRDGDVITVSPLQEALPGTGEVVAFVRPVDGNLVVHRVLGRLRGEGRGGAAVLIQGDNWLGEDGLEYTDGIIPQENLLGRVTVIERNGRPVRLGLGLERFLIAWLSRTRLLVPLQLQLAAWRKRLSE